MTGFDESASFDDGEFDSIRDGESLQHPTSLAALTGAPDDEDACQTGDMRLGEHEYALTTTWTGNLGTGTSGYRAYARDVTIEVAGKPALAASADKPFRGDPSRWNPEDFLLAALSDCHLLSYLHACVVAGVVVVSYSDDAHGVMVEDGRSGGAFREVTLNPRVVVAEAGMLDAARRAHDDAHRMCFIANSVNFPVHHRAVITALGE